MYNLSTVINGNKKSFTVVLNGNIIVSQFDSLKEATNDLILRNRNNG
tara:strand:- start:7829 stop:7969 length:141 start_codon:yes stop_codon:yes gene_type:complete